VSSYFEIEDKIQNQENLNNNDAEFIIEEIIDLLIEIDNGVSEERIKDAKSYMIALKILWFKNIK